MCVVVYYCPDIKICGEGGGAGGRAADQRGAGAAAAARHLGLQRRGAGSEVLRDQAASSGERQQIHSVSHVITTVEFWLLLDTIQFICDIFSTM